MRATLHMVAAADYAAFRAALQPVMERAVRVLGERAKGLEPELVLPAARELLLERPRGFNELRQSAARAVPHARTIARSATSYARIFRSSWFRRTPAGASRRWPTSRSPTSGSEGRCPRTARPSNSCCATSPRSARPVPQTPRPGPGLQGLAPVFEALRPQLLVFKGESGRRELFDLPDAPRPGEDIPAPARFLPEFDNLVLAHADRTRLLADEHRGALVTKNLRVRAAFLWDGMVAGTWEVQRRRGAVTLVMTPFRALPARACQGTDRRGRGAAALRGGRRDGVRGSDHAGVRPCRRMTSPIAARSGGPPADAASTVVDLA